QDLELAKSYWKNKLQGFTETSSLKIYGQNLDKEANSQKQEIEISSEITNALKSVAQKYNLTLNTIIQGVFAILLSRYTNNDDIIYGTTTSGRPANFPGIESMVGLFINTLPMRVQLSDTDSFLSWLEKLQQQQIENLQYEYTPLATIQELSELPQGTPLLENIFVFENYPVDTKSLAKNQKLKVQSIDIQESNNFPLTCLVKVSTEIAIAIQYKSDRFDDNTISRLLDSFEYLLTQIIDNPQQKLGELSILTPQEQELIVSWQETQVDYPLDKTIPELFAEQVEKTPDNIALIFEEKEYTYQELNESANQLANHLRELGVRPETPVGIYLERSEKMAIAILAILKAGGAYVPLDPDYPNNRINFIIEDTRINIVLTESQHQQNIDNDKLTIIDLNGRKPCAPTASSAPSAPSASSAPSALTSNNAAYIIYTSGSTGKPKGVINTHRALVNRLLWMQDQYQLTTSDRILQKTPFSFDVSVWEFFWPWLNGACLVMAKPEGHKDSNYLVNLITETKITVLHFVPSMLQVFLEEAEVSNCQSIKKVICSGEALTVGIKQKFFQKLNAELHNLYGPTEAAIDVTSYQCHDDQDKIVPIGNAITNTQIYILNSQQQINPIGVPGELYIGGVGLARGYVNRPELTAEKFIPNSFNNIETLHAMRSESFRATSLRLYKTGDLACYLPDGNIQYLGRIDNNVKVRGFRIELGEIETVLEQYPVVKKAIAIIRDDLSVNPQIIAYITGNKNLIQGIKQELIEAKLRRYLESELPYYMIPNSFVFVEDFPLTTNGKLDRKALPKPEIKTKTFVTPRSDLEIKIAAIWQEVLQIDKVSVEDNFFDLGGNSLSATRINSRIREKLDIELPLRTIFEKPTVATIAQRIELIELSVKQQADTVVSDQTNRKEIEI
ncbi:MAG: amino acid adenylation domain-containing protein, partial [Cyanobacteria bacterium P01_F01_bin.143]